MQVLCLHNALEFVCKKVSKCHKSVTLFLRVILFFKGCVSFTHSSLSLQRHVLKVPISRRSTLKSHILNLATEEKECHTKSCLAGHRKSTDSHFWKVGCNAHSAGDQLGWDYTVAAPFKNVLQPQL